ncbi:OmpA family protein [Brevundimonas sp. R86498]|uniref:OmpA family protein n=1 Tax=Brevundimonas sp. R86498 TaxID=3093845 RepID=UPI0037C843D2
MRVITRLGLAAAFLGLSACSGAFPGRGALVTVPDSCSPQRFDIYFAENAGTLTDAARTAIGLTASRLEICRIRSVQVLGLASSTGGSSDNLALSERRAAAVVSALAAAGWPAPVFDVTAAGDTGAMAAPGVQEPLRRRTEVLVDAAPL